MRHYWQRITVEVILGILIELSPASLNIWATVAEYLVKISGEKVSSQAIFSSIEQHGERNFTFSGSKSIAPILVA